MRGSWPALWMFYVEKRRAGEVLHGPAPELAGATQHRPWTLGVSRWSRGRSAERRGPGELRVADSPGEANSVPCSILSTLRRPGPLSPQSACARARGAPAGGGAARPVRGGGAPRGGWGARARPPPRRCGRRDWPQALRQELRITRGFSFGLCRGANRGQGRGGGWPRRR